MGKVVPLRCAEGHGSVTRSDFGQYDRRGAGVHRGADVDKVLAPAGGEGISFPVTCELESGLRMGAAEGGLGRCRGGRAERGTGSAA